MDLSVPAEVLDRGDIESSRGLGRDSGRGETEDRSLAAGESEPDFVPSFHGGGEDAWNRSWPFSSARRAI